MARELGVDTLVIVKSPRDIAAVAAGNALATLASLAKAERDSDEVHVGRHAAYVWCPSGILESKVAVALLDRLGDSDTTRNWSTVVKLHVLLTGPEQTRPTPGDSVRA